MAGAKLVLLVAKSRFTLHKFVLEKSKSKMKTKKMEFVSD